MASERVDLNVSYEERGHARQLKCTFDKKKKVWYCKRSNVRALLANGCGLWVPGYVPKRVNPNSFPETNVEVAPGTKVFFRGERSAHRYTGPADEAEWIKNVLAWNNEHPAHKVLTLAKGTYEATRHRRNGEWVEACDCFIVTFPATSLVLTSDESI